MAAFRGCEICKRPIESERAEMLPRTRLCVAHARTLEAVDRRGELLRVVTHESTTKQGSLKKTGGTGIWVRFKRNHKSLDRLRDQLALSKMIAG